ncbi:hypothetical protein LINGRAHAP2_LOCUS6667 [Linum grandiflorum]
MASPTAFLLLATLLVLVQTPLPSSGDFLSPLLAPVMGNVCEKIECGRGKCKPSTNLSIIPFECDCDNGWKQSLPNLSDGLPVLNFLPCIIPNCSMNLDCDKPAEAPATGKPNITILDPCSWADCGGGSCNKTSMFTYSCVCSEGYNNLLNTSIFPCYKECGIGMDCKDLGIGVQGPPAPTPVLSQNDGPKNQGTPIGRGMLNWPLALMVSLVAIVQL